MVDVVIKCKTCKKELKFKDNCFVECSCGNIRLLYDVVGYAIQCKSISDMEYTIVETKKNDPDYIPK